MTRTGTAGTERGGAVRAWVRGGSSSPSAPVSLLADFVYEGARSITGPVLAHLGATAAVVGIVTDAGYTPAATASPSPPLTPISPTA